MNLLEPNTFSILKNSFRSDAVIFDDPKNLAHSAVSPSLAYALGYCSSHDTGHRVCSDSVQIRTVTTDTNEIVSTQQGHRYLTFDELAHITSPRDEQLHQRWKSMSLLDASREMANMIPAAMLEAIYKSVATLFRSWPRTPTPTQTVSAHFAATVEHMPVASVQVLHEADHFLFRTSKNAPHVRTRPASPRTKRSPSVKSPVRKLRPISAKRTFVPKPNQQTWLPSPSIKSEKFADVLYRVWYLSRVFPLSPTSIEHLIAANPGIIGVPAGASRLLPWLPNRSTAAQTFVYAIGTTFTGILPKPRVRTPRFLLVP